MSEVEKARLECDKAAEAYKNRIAPWQVVADAQEVLIAAVRAESVGHEANCRCHDKRHHELAMISLTRHRFNRENLDDELSNDCTASAETCPGYTDPRCLPGLKREAIIRAEAELEILESMWDLLHLSRNSWPNLRRACIDARAELERLREK
jgi:hypothetical protein